jgi:hypothetical protein
MACERLISGKYSVDCKYGVQGVTNGLKLHWICNGKPLKVSHLSWVIVYFMLSTQVLNFKTGTKVYIVGS